jgi:hypothetical protein
MLMLWERRMHFRFGCKRPVLNTMEKLNIAAIIARGWRSNSKGKVMAMIALWVGDGSTLTVWPRMSVIMVEEGIARKMVDSMEEFIYMYRYIMIEMNL